MLRAVDPRAEPRIDDLALFVGEQGQRAGAAFTLKEAARSSLAWGRGDGWIVRARGGSRIVIASGSSSQDYEEVWHAAHAVVQEGLDYWSYRGLADLATQDPFGGHLAFWDEERGRVVRIAGRSPFNFSAGGARPVIYDAEGKVVPSPPEPRDWHPSMRFFRQSQLTDDLSESLRNLWLAVENLLDAIEPQAGESEEKWLKRALQAAGEKINLAGYMPAPDTSTGPAPAPHNAAYTYFYDDLRRHLFHAKGSRDPLLPNDVEEVRDLARRHSLLSNLYLDLLHQTTGVQRPTGVITFAGFELMTETFTRRPRVLATDDLTPFDANQTEPAPGGGTVVGVEASHEPELAGRGVRAFVAEIPGAEIAKLREARVGRLVFESDGDCVSAHLPDGALFLPGIACLQAQLELGLVNGGQPKQFVGY